MSNIKVEILSDSNNTQNVFKIYKDNVLVNGDNQLTKEEFARITDATINVARILSHASKGNDIKLK